MPRPADDPLLRCSRRDELRPDGAGDDPPRRQRPPAGDGRRSIERAWRSAQASSSEPTVKDLIVLHFTAGTTARSAFDTWRNDPRRIATSYSSISMARSMRSSRPRRGRRTSAFQADEEFRIGDPSASKSPTSGRYSPRRRSHGPELVAKAHHRRRVHDGSVALTRRTAT